MQRPHALLPLDHVQKSGHHYLVRGLVRVSRPRVSKPQSEQIDPQISEVPLKRISGRALKQSAAIVVMQTKLDSKMDLMETPPHAAAGKSSGRVFTEAEVEEEIQRVTQRLKQRVNQAEVEAAIAKEGADAAEEHNRKLLAEAQQLLYETELAQAEARQYRQLLHELAELKDTRDTRGRVKFAPDSN